MAPKNVILQPLEKETTRSTSQNSAKATIAYVNQSTRVMNRSIIKVGGSITLKKQFGTPTLQSNKT